MNDGLYGQELFSVISWYKAVAVAVAAAAFFIGGYKYAAALYSEDIAQMREQAATAMAKQEKAHREAERKSALALSEAMDQLAAARAESIDLRGDVERVRNEANRYRTRLSTTGANPCKHFAERLDRCVGLLEEGSELSEEGASLSQRISGKHDALAKVHNAQ